MPTTQLMVPSMKGMAHPLNNILADLVESSANARASETIEINSSEHMLNGFDEYNNEVSDSVSDEILLLGTDVVSLFGSMGRDLTCRAVRDT